MNTIVMKRPLAFDPYVFDVLMRDLIGHDRAPSAYLVYLHLAAKAQGRRGGAVKASLQMIADATGLSKSSVSTALTRLRRRGLVETARPGPTDIPAHKVLAPWKR